MRPGTVNDTFYSQISEKGGRVKDILQAISLKTNHRTHAENLAIAQAVPNPRKVFQDTYD